MKKKLFLSALVFNFFLFCFLPRLGADSPLASPQAEPEISMDFQDANLKDIMKVFSIQSGLNFIASEAVQDRKVTLYLDKVPLNLAMNKLFKANNLTYELDKDSNIFIVKDWGKLTVETVTKVFYLKFATVSSSSLKEEMGTYITETSSGFGTSSSGSTSGSSGGGSSGGSSGKWSTEDDTGITKAVKKLLSSAGSVIEDFRTNSLIVTDTPDRIAVISLVIASLDISIPQVLLEVEMLDVSKNVVDTIGIKFGQTPFSVAITGASASLGFPYGSWSKLTDSNLGTFNVNNANTAGGSGTYQAQLDFLRTDTGTKFLARPKLLTLNNETAEIRIATNEAVGIKQTTSGAGGATGTITQEAERSETGVILRVTPQINLEAGEITMFIYPKVAEAVASSITSSLGTFRDPEERSTKSMVRVKDGETVILGGLIRNEKTEVITKLPFFGDLPLIGRLFRHMNKSKDKERELLVFITPRIIKEAPGPKMKLAQSKKMALPEREQNTASRALREAEISSSLNNFEKKKK